MTFTSYLTIDGQIHGQITSGVVTGYATGKAGSIVATLDNSGSVENTYRYKPFGNVLSAHEPGPSINFGWQGAFGVSTSTVALANVTSGTFYDYLSATSLQNLLNPFKSYSNGYSSTMDPNQSVGPNCTTTGLSVKGPAVAYYYDEATDTNKTVPIECTFEGGKVKSAVSFELSVDYGKGLFDKLFIVAHITNDCIVCDCKSGKSEGCPDTGCPNYYEAWDIKDSDTAKSIGFQDAGGWVEYPYDTSIRYTTTVPAKYGKSKSLGRYMICRKIPGAPEWTRHNDATCAKGLWSGLTAPDGWDEKTNIVRHNACFWNWCPKCKEGGEILELTPRFKCIQGMGEGPDVDCVQEEIF